MVRKQIAKYIGYPLQDYIKKTDIIKKIQFLRESQFWEESRLYEYRLEKLKNIVKFAYRNVPYYEKLFNSINLKPGDIKKIDDIEKIPILTKEIVRKENMNLVARNFNMKYVKMGKTGGTTGVPIIVYKDTNNRTFTWASYYRWYEWMGLEYGDKTATFWGARTVLSKSLKSKIIDSISNILQNKIVINSFNMRNDDLIKIYENLRTFRPVILKGYLSALLNLAYFIEINGLTELRPKVLSSTTEKLLPHNRSYLEKIFNAPIFDQYGGGELSAISYECNKHNGLHINQEHIICEVLDDNDRPIYGNSGRIIGTDLDNYVMPFIRYENGDLATISKENCSCGINQPLMHSIEGRTVDTITLQNGSKVHGVFFTDILYELGILTDKIQRFQIIQYQPGKINLKLESREPVEQYLKEKLLRSLDTFFVDVELEEMKKIHNESNGKFRYIISKI